ncbi:MAG: hypothetical protein V1725_04455 [archaeon]
MKKQTSITVEENVLLKIQETLKKGSFRNQSHFFEFAARKLLEKNHDAHV